MRINQLNEEYVIILQLQSEYFDEINDDGEVTYIISSDV